MPWKKLPAWATGQIDEALRQKWEFVLEETSITAYSRVAYRCHRL